MAPSAQVERSLRSPGRLPTSLTSFVGRRVEVDKIAGLLGQHRLVTVIGPGGSGKTRLAIEVGREVGARFADGLTWVDLSGVEDGELVVGTIAAAVGIRQRPRHSMVESLAAGLAPRQLLLVLDNCEQVADAVAQTCEYLLVDCDDLWVLATSTIAMRVQGEARFRVPALPVPKPGGTLAEIDASEAVALFVDRVSTADPDFALTDSSREAVGEIVRRLDGMPLAVELAAARLPALGLAELRAGLDDRFTLLVGTSRGAPARQQSLQAALDWSYRLLSEADQGVYRRLAVFAAPFTLMAASAVCGPEAHEVIPHLVDCSLLLQPIEDVDGRTRYRMLETMRAHADTLLTDNERTDAAAALLQWAVTQPWELQSPFEFTERDHATIAWIDAEQDNIRQAVEWAKEHAPPGRLRLEIVLGPWYLQRGRYGEGGAALDAALAACPEASTQTASAAEFWLGYLALRSGKYDDAITRFRSGEKYAERGGHTTWLVDCLGAGAFACMFVGRVDYALLDAARALELAREVEYREGAAYALYVQSTIAHWHGSYEAGLALAEQAQEVMGGRYGRVLEARAVCYTELRLFSQAEEAALAGLAIARERADRAREAWFLLSLADIYTGMGQNQRAATCTSDGLGLAWRFGDAANVFDGLGTAAELCVRMGRPGDGAALLAAARPIAEAIGLASTRSHDAEISSLLKDIEDALSPEELESARRRGSSMGTTAAIELAGSLGTADLSAASGTDGHETDLRLSPRERELLTQVAQGSTDAQIAQRLFISIRTVRSHLDRIRDKTGCRRRADLTRLALQAQLV